MGPTPAMHFQCALQVGSQLTLFCLLFPALLGQLPPLAPGSAAARCGARRAASLAHVSRARQAHTRRAEQAGRCLAHVPPCSRGGSGPASAGVWRAATGPGLLCRATSVAHAFLVGSIPLHRHPNAPGLQLAVLFDQLSSPPLHLPQLRHILPAALQLQQQRLQGEGQQRCMGSGQAGRCCEVEQPALVVMMVGVAWLATGCMACNCGFQP